MKIRLDYRYKRDNQTETQSDFFIDAHAPEIKTLEELKDYIHKFSATWNGSGTLTIDSVRQSFLDDTLKQLSDQISGYEVRF